MSRVNILYEQVLQARFSLGKGTMSQIIQMRHCRIV